MQDINTFYLLEILMLLEQYIYNSMELVEEHSHLPLTYFEQDFVLSFSALFCYRIINHVFYLLLQKLENSHQPVIRLKGCRCK